MTVLELSTQIGYAPTYIGQIVLNLLRPSKRLAIRIQDATNGTVTMTELLAIDPAKGKAERDSINRKKALRKNKAIQ